MRYWLRVRIQDRPGALGALGLAVASVGANIVRVEVLDRSLTGAVDDVILDVPQPAVVGSLFGALSALGGVTIEALRPIRDSGGHADLDLLHAVVVHPSRGLATFTDMVSDVFSADWAMLIDTAGHGEIRHASVEAPVRQVRAFPWLPVHRARVVSPDPHWFLAEPRDATSELAMAACPVGDSAFVLLVARELGPVFHARELFRLESLCFLLHRIVLEESLTAR